MFVGGALLSWPGPKVIRDQLAAFAVCSATSTSLTVVQSEFDAAIRGRALGVFNALGNLGMPIGMVAFGPLADVIPVSWVFLIGGALTVPVGAWLFGYACRHPVAGSPVSGLALEQA
ncbi:hypothetical protein [Bifidobacterium bifidum]|uniref:hypothetical protein n=1 Tax=Bifidobacterium bifidum TaxID=1681 RepID=UPI001C22527B|nr:hypothetical protein [Bifidobacterium bifidum]MBU8984053.1 hypothetical protein [Bifidobacterium bifidum]MBU8987356.1 hypothetical protein [Bifidobacterium bifidum]